MDAYMYFIVPHRPVQPLTQLGVKCLTYNLNFVVIGLAIISINYDNTVIPKAVVPNPRAVAHGTKPRNIFYRAARKLYDLAKKQYLLYNFIHDLCCNYLKHGRESVLHLSSSLPVMHTKTRY